MNLRDSYNTVDDLKSYVPYMYGVYTNKAISLLKKQFNISNIHCVPRIEKIVISSSISNTKHDKTLIQKMFNCLYLITGLKPVYTVSSRSIAQFKLYKGHITGCKVVLRKNYMYEFIERLCHIYMTNIKGFNGISKRSIVNGVLNIGIVDAQIMPEIGEFDAMLFFGMTISVVMNNCKDTEMACSLLRLMDFPIRDDL